MPVIQAQNIVNAAIQDSQNQTTNRTALYDYTDRVHQRILRESKWRFLLSDPQVFVTMPGVGSYTLVSGTPPAGAFPTNNQLTNFLNIAPGSVFNLSTWTKLEEDDDAETTLNYIINRDGSLRYGYPRTYSNSIANPGTITLKPVPDDQNLYYPIPETPFVTYVQGGSLPERIYWGVVTFQDNFQGESTQCAIPFTIAIPAGYLLQVTSPNPAMGGISGNQAIYGWWNVYVGAVQNNYNRQNVAPINIGTNWTEGVLGINTGTLAVPSMTPLPPINNDTFLAITNTGFLETINYGTPVLPSFWALEDTSGNWWEVTTNSAGHLITQSIAQTPATTNVYTAIYLTDTSAISTWKITVTTGGQLTATVFTTPPTTAAINGQPPATSTIQPLNAYVIQFRYYMQRNQIVNPTDVLQIPYQYKDIVIAGVNYLTARYSNVGRATGVNQSVLDYKAEFEAGLMQIRRDLKAQFRKVDFISPDTVTQYQVGNQQGIPTMGW